MHSMPSALHLASVSTEGGLSLLLQARYRTGPFPADGAELIWKMAQILEKGGETEWVKTIVTVCIYSIHPVCHLTLHVALPR